MPDRDPPPPGRSAHRPRSSRPPAPEPLAAVPLHRTRRSSRPPRVRDDSLPARIGAALLALVCALAACALALQHPLAPAPLLLGTVPLLLLGRFFWAQMPGWSLGLLPWLSLAPQTGWLLVEEFDIALLALLAGAYLAISGPHRSRPPPLQAPARQQLRWHRGICLLLGLALLSAAAAVGQGVAAWPDAQPGWFDGATTASASWRAAKPWLALLLMLPLWWRVARRRPDQLAPSVLAGAGLALLGCTLPVVAALLGGPALGGFVGERVGGPFWETHLGGGALDAVLVLLLPLGLLGLARARSVLGRGAMAVVLLAGAAAALLGGSPAAHLGLLLSLPLLAWRLARQQPRSALAALLLAAAAAALLLLRPADFTKALPLHQASQGLASVETRNAWVFGIGAGRYANAYAHDAAADEQAGEYRLHPGRPAALDLRSGLHRQGSALWMTQQVGAPDGPLTLTLQARNDTAQRLQVRLCPGWPGRHGMAACRAQTLALPATAGAWVEQRVRLDDAGQRAGARVLLLSPADPGAELELTALRLRSADGRDWLRNGDFRDALAHWFPVATGSTEAWHAPLLPLHLLVEQGVLGLGLALLLLVLALARLLWGDARRHPLAPALAASLLGFAGVGLFHSLVDTPRVAWLFLTLLVLALGLRAPPPDSSS